jgi:hypothetical protein
MNEMTIIRARIEEKKKYFYTRHTNAINQKEK